VTGIPVFKLVINPSTDEKQFSGVDYVALVDEPAIEKYFHAFKAHKEPIKPKFKFEVVGDERRLICGALMIPNLPIYRNQDGKEYYVVFDAPTIEQVCQKFFKMGFTSNVNEMHDDSLIPKNVYMVESFIVDSKRGIKAPEGFGYLPEGTWFGTFKVENDDVWAKVKDGTFTGFSVEGFFDMVPDEITDEQAVEAIRSAILEQPVS
jgi:Putative phage serine protease XkdF